MRHAHQFVGRSALALLTALGLAASAAGAPITYFGIDDPRGVMPNSFKAQSDFLTTLSVYGTDDLESTTPFVPSPTLVFAGTALTATTNSAYVATFAPLAVSGSNALVDQGPASAGDPGIPDVFTFSSPITAFGSFFSNVGDAATANTITFTLENTSLATSKDVVVGPLGPGASFTNVFYFGVTDSDPFDRVTISESFDYDGALLDNITAGYVVPEPATYVLLALGGVLVVAARRARRQ